MGDDIFWCVLEFSLAEFYCVQFCVFVYQEDWSTIFFFTISLSDFSYQDNSDFRERFESIPSFLLYGIIWRSFSFIFFKGLGKFYGKSIWTLGFFWFEVSFFLNFYFNLVLFKFVICSKVSFGSTCILKFIDFFYVFQFGRI